MNATETTAIATQEKPAIDPWRQTTFEASKYSRAKGRNGFFNVKAFRLVRWTPTRPVDFPPLILISPMSRAMQFPGACHIELTIEDATKLRDTLDTLLKEEE